jgi:glyoxylase-like metal-dependent hydrolase (beta-lactamase superfamily II)
MRNVGLARLVEHESQDVLDLRLTTAFDVTQHRGIAAPGHTPGHTAFVVASGKEQLMVLSDTTNMPALFAKHPNWHGAIDADPVLAETTRRRLFDRAVSDKALVTGYHFPFPAVGTIVPDGTGYTFVPAA